MKTEILVGPNKEEENPFGRVTATALAAFERTHGLRLPTEYRTYLLERNGGLFTNSFFHITDEQGDTRLLCMYGVHKGPAGLRLENALAFLRREYRGSDDYMPVGEDCSGCLVCIGLTGDKTGCVFFLDKNFGVFILVALTFASFVAALKATSDEAE